MKIDGDLGEGRKKVGPFPFTLVSSESSPKEDSTKFSLLSEHSFFISCLILHLSLTLFVIAVIQQTVGGQTQKWENQQHEREHNGLMESDGRQQLLN